MAKVGNFYTFQTKKQYIYEDLTEQRNLISEEPEQSLGLG